MADDDLEAPELISDINYIKNNNSLVTYYNKYGSEVKNKESAFAKKITTPNDKIRHFIVFDSLGVIDALNLSLHKKRSNWHFKRVDLEVFDSYIKYLKYNKSINLVVVRRLLSDY